MISFFCVWCNFFVQHCLGSPSSRRPHFSCQTVP